MITANQLTFGYISGLPVFQDFSWETARGESWAVIGPSGCGKSTLLALIAGLMRPQSGNLRVDGQELVRPRPCTGLIIQDYGLLPWATVRENTRLGLRVRNLYGPDSIHAPRNYQPTLEVDAWLERLGLMPFANQYPGQISGGQRQRTAIARTLSLQPDLLLMDEPFSSLDAPTRENLQRLVLELWVENNLTMVTVTHAIEEAAVLGQKILLLSQPPNRTALIFENPNLLDTGFRESKEYSAICRLLRERLEST